MYAETETETAAGPLLRHVFSGRGERIRTSGLYVPNDVL